MYLSHWVGIDEVTDDEGKHFSVAADRRCAERTLEKLADLIDRPTCRNVSGYQDTFKCSECGYKIGLIAEVCNEHSELLHMPLMPLRCPNCKAEVVE